MMAYATRKNIRLANWDYSSHGVYHVTICTHDKACLFGRIETPSEAQKRMDCSLTPKMSLSELGRICESVIAQTEADYADITLLTHVVMPNHIHLLVSIKAQAATKLGSFVRTVKARTTTQARKLCPNIAVWQRGYHDHIIRGEHDFEATWEYIENNPAKWADDTYYHSA